MFINNKNKLVPKIKNGKFFNPNDTFVYKGFSKYVYLIYSLMHEIFIFIKSTLNFNKRLPKNLDYWSNSKSEVVKSSYEPNITWIGHATFLIQIADKNILTDPIFGNSTFLFPRIHKPGIDIHKLPKIDYIIISHNHVDHMCKNSLLKLIELNPQVKIMVPIGDKKWFETRNFKSAFEFTWWQEYVTNKDLKFTFLPAQHWSQRFIFDGNKSLWGSWMIEHNNFKIYFAGDTAYAGHFKSIGQEFNNIDVALLPVGPCEPREKMCFSHTSSEEAGQAFLDLNAKNFIPMHWGTFHFGTDFFDTPIVRLRSWWNSNVGLSNDKILNIVKFGQRLEFNYKYNQTSQEKTINL